MAGLIMAIWGLIIIAPGEKPLQWPSVDGVIEQSPLASEENDILPGIAFGYTVARQRYRRDMALPGAGGITPDFAGAYVKKYPQGTRVRVHYNPRQPGQVTLEPGLARDDWLVFAVGTSAALLEGLFLLFK